MITYDDGACDIFFDGERRHMGHKSYAIFTRLLRARGTTVPLDVLVDEGGFDIEKAHDPLNNLRVQICKARRSVAGWPVKIESVHALGYRATEIKTNA